MTNEELIDPEDVLVAELAAGKTVREAATAAGVPERTAYRRWSNRELKLRVSEVRAAAMSAATGRLIESMMGASAALRELLTHDETSVRHKAAVKLIELAMKAHRYVELERRLSTLEAALSATIASGTNNHGKPPETTGTSVGQTSMCHVREDPGTSTE